MKFKKQIFAVFVGCMFVLSGCSYSAIDNQTPRMAPQNPSNFYRISMQVKKTNIKIAPDSYKSQVLIDDKAYDMVKSGDREFYFDYKEEDRHVINYRYKVYYSVGSKEKSMRSRNYKLNIINRYAVGFECNRGKPYSEISLLGRGFVEGDRVMIGDCVCDTTFVSPNVLSFVVPMLEGGRTYRAVLDSENGDIGLGDFFIDPASITTDPTKIDLSRGEKCVLTVTVDVEAPPEGLPLDVTTDIPDSIIMHDVVIRPGMRSARVVVEGGRPGKGSLFIAAPGVESCEIPVVVSADSARFKERVDMEYSSLTDLENDVILEE